MLQAYIKESRSRSFVHFPILLLVWPIKCGTNFTQAKVDDFEASKFSFSNGLTKLPLVQCGLSLEELLPNVNIVPKFATVDIQSMHPIPICSPIISDSDKQPKYWKGKLF